MERNLFALVFPLGERKIIKERKKPIDMAMIKIKLRGVRFE